MDGTLNNQPPSTPLISIGYISPYKGLLGALHPKGTIPDHFPYCCWFRNPKQPPFGCKKPLVFNGIKYQPQLVSLPDFSHQQYDNFSPPHPSYRADRPVHRTHVAGIGGSRTRSPGRVVGMIRSPRTPRISSLGPCLDGVFWWPGWVTWEGSRFLYLTPQV